MRLRIKNSIPPKNPRVNHVFIDLWPKCRVERLQMSCGTELFAPRSAPSDPKISVGHVLECRVERHSPLPRSRRAFEQTRGTVSCPTTFPPWLFSMRVIPGRLLWILSFRFFDFCDLVPISSFDKQTYKISEIE